MIRWSVFVFFLGSIVASNAQSWRAGVARQIITPQDSVWMAGYASRTHSAEVTLHDLWIKVLALEDSLGNRAVLITSDLLGFPRNISKTVTDRIIRRTGLKRSQIMLTSSHTHSGPVLRESLYPAYPLNPARISLIDVYSHWLEEQMVETVISAFEKLEPVSLHSGQGTVRFGVNRRNNVESQLSAATELAGPVDHSVPVLMIRKANLTPLAIVFGYACHATVLSAYQWSGDYPGFAQLALEEAYPEVTAMFFAGAGGDINPLPRRSVPLAQQYGEELASAVKRVMNEDMMSLTPVLKAQYQEIELPYDVLPDREYLSQQIEAEDSPFYIRNWARSLLKQMDDGEEIPPSYSYYPVQYWQLGQQKIIALGGEVVVEYAIHLKRLWGQDIFVIAYANDVMAYIPSPRILREGGYEGFTSSRIYNRPSIWGVEIEHLIIEEVFQQILSLNSKE